MQTKENEKSWNSVSITQFELAKLIYTSGFLKNVNLTATTKLVLMALVQHYNANNADMFPSQKFLAKQLGISEKSVERSIANLKSENLIDYVTKKVNRYRFTAKFFELIKMSVKHRQNVGSDIRQNVGQTKKEEKINKKENFLNFLGDFDKLQENVGKQDCDLSQLVNQNGAKAPQEKSFSKNSSKNKKFENKNNEIVSPCVHFANLTGRADELQTAQNTQNKSFLEIENARKITDFEKNTKKIKQIKSSKSTINKGFSDFAKDDKKSFLPNQNTENALQTDNSAWLSPLDFDFDNALLWVKALPIPLKGSKFAQKLCEKYNFSQEDIYSDEQKEKLLQYRENDYAELDLGKEKFI